MYIKG